MKREHLEFFLDQKGYSLGFREQSPDRTFAAWLILSKRKPNERLLSILKPGEEPEFVNKQELFRERPYQMVRIEYRRDTPIRIEDDVEEDKLVRGSLFRRFERGRRVRRRVWQCGRRHKMATGNQAALICVQAVKQIRTRLQPVGTFHISGCLT